MAMSKQRRSCSRSRPEKFQTTDVTFPVGSLIGCELPFRGNAHNRSRGENITDTELRHIRKDVFRLVFRFLLDVTVSGFHDCLR